MECIAFNCKRGEFFVRDPDAFGVGILVDMGATQTSFNFLGFSIRMSQKDRGIGADRFPDAHLYRRYGLYEVPTAAGWKSAQASV